ncbi:MAG: DUF3047 domain-containing protein [Rhodothermales bacterium]
MNTRFSQSNVLLRLLLVMTIVLLTGAASEDLILKVGDFSKAEGDSPLVDGWEVLTLGKNDRTHYHLIEHEGVKVVRAMSNNAVSGLRKEVNLDPEKYHTLKWRWKVSNVLQGGDVTRKKGDDFAARVFITFEYDKKKLSLQERIKHSTLRLLGYGNTPLRSLNYIWANKAPAGTMVSSPYTDLVKMIAVRDNAAHLNTWHTEEQNIYEDYEAAFGEKPGRIKDIVIMTDTDNTGEAAMAYFGDIVFTQMR